MHETHGHKSATSYEHVEEMGEELAHKSPGHRTTTSQQHGEEEHEEGQTEGISFTSAQFLARLSPREEQRKREESVSVCGSRHFLLVSHTVVYVDHQLNIETYYEKWIRAKEKRASSVPQTLEEKRKDTFSYVVTIESYLGHALDVDTELHYAVIGTYKLQHGDRLFMLLRKRH